MQPDTAGLGVALATRVPAYPAPPHVHTLLDHKVDADVLMALDRLALLDGLEETPVVQRGEQQPTQTRRLRRLQDFDPDGTVGVNREARKRNRVIRGFTTLRFRSSRVRRLMARWSCSTMLFKYLIWRTLMGISRSAFTA
ncbi:hypothetical protein LMG28727_07002 [Paraburkholderia kirstenboschensis]|nr:hypothetical protein LMG28727_07002 [Paraburkholderia kirstenboschensis]